MAALKKMTETEAVEFIDTILSEAIDNGLDHEQILAIVFAKHTKSNDSQCDKCHMYGITLAQKINKQMELFGEK